MDPLLAHSRRTIARGSKSFALAARLFDRTTRNRALLLYAWCRHCDDVIDGQVLGSSRLHVDARHQQARLAEIRALTDAALAGAPLEDPAFRSLQRVVQECRIEPRYPLELLDGFAMDVRGERYASFDDTLRYCYHVAGTVGAMMARIMGVRDAATLTRGIHLGIALQLTNVARDVMDDARAGRVYLPGAWLEDVGVAPQPAQVLAAPERVARVVVRLLDAAEPYYASAGRGIARLPFRSAWAVHAAARVYGEIGALVRSRGAAAWRQRLVVPGQRKLALVARAGVGVIELRRRAPQLPEGSGLWEPGEPGSPRYPSKR